MILEELRRAVALLLALFARLSCALPVFEKLILLFGQNSAHLNQSLDGDCLDVDHELTD